MDSTSVYVIVGVVAILAIAFVIWTLFVRKRLGPPVEQVNNAENALSDAKQKEADLYSQEEYLKAQDSLAKAKHLLAAKEYRKAREEAVEASEQAAKAAKTVEEKKTKMKAENEKMLADFDKQVDELKHWAAKRETDAAAKINPEVQELVGKWEIMKLKIPDLIQRGRIREAYDDLKIVEGEIQRRRQDFAAKTGA